MNSVKIKPDRQQAAKSVRKTYHHGDLRRQLIAAAEQVIVERGVDGFTLREAARRVGVSPAAPSHHFKDAKGLLTEVALLGFRDFGEALAAADKRGGQDPMRRLNEQGIAYVQFALKFPARFQLMFRVDKHDHTNAEFVRVSQEAYCILENAIRAATGTPADRPLGPDGQGLLVAVWSMVHGYCHLAFGGELNNPARGGGNTDVILESLLPLMLKYLPLPIKK
ncbi:TetR/AcrR family transcriptional regulator [Rhizobium sp. BR 315]|uniref:TetR/AcrR family transcriptional regulator n=1 Tax=Rhizobium sp. BR 315 TaxID=3040014 RepID=UPI003D334E91